VTDVLDAYVAFSCTSCCVCHSLLQPELDYTAGWGGAVSVATAAAVQSVVRNCTFTDNTAPVCCGALFIGSTALIDGCTFNDNAVTVGVAGALSTHQSTVLTNSIFSRNSGHAVSATDNYLYLNLKIKLFIQFSTQPECALLYCLLRRAHSAQVKSARWQSVCG
jgi:hypothetical protein